MHTLNRYRKYVTLTLALVLPGSAFAAWTKVWEDAFNSGSGWNIKNDWTRNCCLGIYTDNMVVISGGICKIRASGYDYTNSAGTYSYQSGWLDTQNRRFFGVNHSIRGRCRIMNRFNGVNYGFWLLRQGGGSPIEIDLYEYPYAQDQGGNRFKFTIHKFYGAGGSTGNWKSGITHTDWNNYRVDLRPTYIEASVNGAQISYVTNSNFMMTSGTQYYVILSTVVDNNAGWHGTPGTTNWGPAEQQCEWVQAWEWN